MTLFDDDLLTALHAARPAADYQPPAGSPEAAAMLTRILAAPEAPTRRVTSRRLLLAGVPAVAGMAAAVALAVTLAPSGNSSRPGGDTGLTTSDVRTAVLDAFQRDSGDIMYATQTIRRPKGSELTQRSWTYPAFAVPGQQVRYRLFSLADGVPSEDTESIYIQDEAATRLSMSTTEGPRSAEIIDVQYATRTWSRQRSSSVLLGGSLSPSLIRDQIASGRFTVAGTGQVQGRRAVELTWSSAPGQRIVTTTTLWVDARTYVPLRAVSTLRAELQARAVPLATITTQYQMLSATPANLNLLSPPIPAGFTRIPRSPNF